MQCPVDQTTLAMTERQGIEIDYCPQCRGVWLDRGELDKLIDAGAGTQPAFRAGEQPRQPQQPRYDDRSRSRDIHSSDDPSYRYGKRKKKEGFLSDLFDF
jgi:uncharacterized protein